MESKRKNLAMAWVDYRKGYDMVPHSWLLELAANGEVLGTVKIMIPLSIILKDEPKRFVFGKSGKLINHLLSMDVLKLYAMSESERKTRNLLTMFGAFHKRVNRLYPKRNDGGRGLISVEECVRAEEFV